MGATVVAVFRTYLDIFKGFLKGSRVLGLKAGRIYRTSWWFGDYGEKSHTSTFKVGMKIAMFHSLRRDW